MSRRVAKSSSASHTARVFVMGRRVAKSSSAFRSRADDTWGYRDPKKDEPLGVVQMLHRCNIWALFLVGGGEYRPILPEGFHQSAGRAPGVTHGFSQPFEPLPMGYGCPSFFRNVFSDTLIGYAGPGQV